MNENTTMMTVATARGDVTGDGVPDKVSLLGRKTQSSPFVQDITLAIQDGRSMQTEQIPLPYSSGYNPGLFLGDFTGDGVLNIFIQIDSGGSGAITYDLLYSYKNRRPFVLFDSDSYNSKYTFDVEYMDGYLVKVVSHCNGMVYLLNNLYKGKEYLNEIYDADGKLKRPIQGIVSPLSSLFPVDLERDGVFELMAFQGISGQYMADGLGYVQNILKFRAMCFQLENQMVGIYGAKAT